MSTDIRSFFQPKKVQKVVIEDDDDVIPESPDVPIKNKKKQPRKKRVLSDSDEEIFESKKKKIENECHTKSKNKSRTPQKPLKEVKAVDMFGSTPIKRTEPIVKKEKVKKNTETGIHSDEEFDKSLLELDDVDVFSKIDTNDSLNKSSKKHEKNIKTTEEKSPRKSKESLKNNEQNKTKRDIHVSKSSPKKSKLDNENKRKFAEFIEDKIVSNSSKQDVNTKKIKSDHNITEGTTNKIKKVLKNGGSSGVANSNVVEKSFNESTHEITKTKKMNKSLNDSVLTDEERHERKIHSAALYQKYLNRTGPKNLGSKEMPEGLPDCLKDCAILLTGVLESFEREEITEAIVKYGGSIKNQISRKVTHVLAGEEPGPAKMAKAQELGIKIINEDEFLELIRSSSKKKPERNNVDIKKEKTPSGKINTDSKSSTKKSQEKHKSCSPKDNKIPKIKKEEDSRNLKKSDHREKIKSPIKNKSEIKVEKDILKSDVKIDNVLNDNKTGSCENNQSDPSMMWVDKYKPQNLKQIIGQHGEASNVKKLSNWLTKWYINRKAKLPKPNPWAKNDDGGFYKAALLSGPPGVGKTTTVALVCKELGFDVVEFNASDTRSKNLIKEQITELLTTTSLSAYAKGDTGKQAVTKKHVLVMDEVDGMAGNEDRGGLQELIGLIKITSVPIICMCNDRNSQKMRSLVNYCYDLRFNRPRVDQIKSAMMSICFKEGVKVPPDVLTQLIVAANQDVRQTLHLLSMWAADPAHAHPDALRKDASKPKKDIKLGPWEAVRKVFSAEEHKTMSINDKSDLFFYDYSLAPLFVQENYLQVQPHCPKNDILDRVAKAADSISAGNLVDSRIRSNQAWSLLPIQAMFSSVIPGQAMSGHIVGQIQFPGWLGKNSRATKMHRLCQEIHAHTRLSTSGSKSSIFLDYCTHLRDAIVTPLIKDRADGIAKSMEVLESYHLLREDLDSLTEMSLWPGQRNPMVLIDSKVKAAMTRTYNKSATALPYAPGSIKKGRTRNEADEEFEEEVDEEDEDSDPENDALIKKKKIEKPSSNKQKASSSKDKPSSSKDKPSSSKDKSSSSKDKKGKKKNEDQVCYN